MQRRKDGGEEVKEREGGREREACMLFLPLPAYSNDDINIILHPYKGNIYTLIQKYRVTGHHE